MTTHGAGTWLQVSARWLHLISFAALAGVCGRAVARPAQKGRSSLTLPVHGRFACPFSAINLDCPADFYCLMAVYDLFRFIGWGVGGLVETEIYLLAIITLTIGVDAWQIARRSFC